MGQCVTKCKNPSSTLGSKNGDREAHVKAHGKRSTSHKEELSLVGRKPSGDILVNGTKKVEAAIESNQPPTSSGDARKEPVSGCEESFLHRTEELFRRYKDEREDAILEEGMERFCNDLCVDPTEFKVLVLAWKFQAATMCKFTRKEFFEGCQAINADCIDGICTRFPGLLTEAKQEDKFKDLYRFTFQFGLDSDEGQRSLHREIAIALWKLVFTQNKPPILDQSSGRTSAITARMRLGPVSLTLSWNGKWRDGGRRRKRRVPRAQRTYRQDSRVQTITPPSRFHQQRQLHPIQPLRGP